MLIDELPALEAYETFMSANATALPYMKSHGQKEFLRQIQSRFDIPRPRPRPKLIRHDPTAAAEWFRQHGVTVIDESSNHGGDV